VLLVASIPDRVNQAIRRRIAEQGVFERRVPLNDGAPLRATNQLRDRGVPNRAL
jgi:hypothetical protein